MLMALFLLEWYTFRRLVESLKPPGTILRIVFLVPVYNYFMAPKLGLRNLSSNDWVL